MSTNSGSARAGDRSSAAPSASECFHFQFKSGEDMSMPQNEFSLSHCTPISRYYLHRKPDTGISKPSDITNQEHQPSAVPIKSMPILHFLLQNDTQGEYIPESRNQTNANSIRMNAGGIMLNDGSPSGHKCNTSRQLHQNRQQKAAAMCDSNPLPAMIAFCKSTLEHRNQV